MSDKKLTHLDDQGNAHMVDVSSKDVTARTATAQGRVGMSADALSQLKDQTAKKGDVIATARLAGIMAAKKTADLIPLCHQLPLSKVALTFDTDDSGVSISATVKTTAQTGVEMEAMTAVSVAALTIYDMLKAVDRAMQITGIRLTHKDGGKSGLYTFAPNMPNPAGTD